MSCVGTKSWNLTYHVPWSSQPLTIEFSVIVIIAGADVPVGRSFQEEEGRVTVGVPIATAEAPKTANPEATRKVIKPCILT